VVATAQILRPIEAERLDSGPRPEVQPLSCKDDDVNHDGYQVP